MDTFGRHLLVEYRGCDPAVLDNLSEIESLMRRAAMAARATIVTSTFHPFYPQGVSGVVVVQESHLSIHTWPEHGYAAVDFYTCGECVPEQAQEFLRRGLKADAVEIMVVQRGRPADHLRVTRHEATGHVPSSDFEEWAPRAAGVER